ncbi:MAG: cohesin domain-containing protein [Candidatus Nomurabacteria bacterium]|nr:cohesin domain-containing protein [Candidatus Nomurabacteria bacterium]
MFILSFFVFFIIPTNLFASEIVLKTNTPTLGVGDEFTVQVILSNNTENVNAISGDINFDDNLLSAESILSANSIVPIWIENPRISGNSIIFSGIMPGGYQSVVDPVTQNPIEGVILNITFKVKAQGVGKISFNDIHVYKNDGLGTEDITQTRELFLNLNSIGSHYVVSIVDTISPEDFTPMISKDSNMYDGQSVLVFNTNDKQSGIDHYEIKEGNRNWILAESPYLLVDQTLSSEISIKAIDLAGNYKIEKVNSRNIPSKFIFIVVLLLIILITLLIHGAYVRYHKRRIQKN